MLINAKIQKKPPQVFVTFLRTRKEFTDRCLQKFKSIWYTYKRCYGFFPVGNNAPLPSLRALSAAGRPGRHIGGTPVPPEKAADGAIKNESRLPFLFFRRQTPGGVGCLPREKTKNKFPFIKHRGRPHRAAEIPVREHPLPENVRRHAPCLSAV